MNDDKSGNMSSERLPFEEAMNKVGFGLYAFLLTGLTGFSITSFMFIAYGPTFVAPTSACELETTSSQQGIVAAGPIVGLILGAVAWGYLADTRGRRRTLLMALACATIYNIIATISVNWIMLLIFQFLASLSASGIYSISMSLLSESVPLAKRNCVVLVVASIFILGQGVMALLAIPVMPLTFSHHLPVLGIYWNSWRTFLLLATTPTVITFICILFVHESPKFLYTKGDEDGALEVLRRIHGFGKAKSKSELRVKGLLKDESTAAAGPLAAKDQIVPLFKAPLLKYTLLVCILCILQQISAFTMWLPTIFDQFVRILQTGEFTDFTMCDILNMEPAPADPDSTPCALDPTAMWIIAGVGVVHFIFNICISVLIGFVGRRNIALALILICGVSGILVNLVPNVIGSAVLFVIMTVAILAIGLYTAIAVALFPTHLRAMAIALMITTERAGSFASTQILNLLLQNNCELGFYLFSSIFLTSVIAAMFLPDDRKFQAVRSTHQTPRSEAEKLELEHPVRNKICH